MKDSTQTRKSLLFCSNSGPASKPSQSGLASQFQQFTKQVNQKHTDKKINVTQKENLYAAASVKLNSYLKKAQTIIQQQQQQTCTSQQSQVRSVDKGDSLWESQFTERQQQSSRNFGKSMLLHQRESFKSAETKVYLGSINQRQMTLQLNDLLTLVKSEEQPEADFQTNSIPLKHPISLAKVEPRDKYFQETRKPLKQIKEVAQNQAQRKQVDESIVSGEEDLDETLIATHIYETASSIQFQGLNRESLPQQRAPKPCIADILMQARSGRVPPSRNIYSTNIQRAQTFKTQYKTLSNSSMQRKILFKQQVRKDKRNSSLDRSQPKQEASIISPLNETPPKINLRQIEVQSFKQHQQRSKLSIDLSLNSSNDTTSKKSEITQSQAVILTQAQTDNHSQRISHDYSIKNSYGGGGSGGVFNFAPKYFKHRKQ